MTRAQTTRSFFKQQLPYKRLTLVLLILLLPFFLLQFLSEGFLTLGTRSADAPQTGYLRIASRLFPLDPTPLYEYGFYSLQKYEKSKDPRFLSTGIAYLEKALGLNMYLYYAHHYLGKAYLLLNATRLDTFDQGVKSLHRAAGIRSNNLQVSLDTMRMYLSLWPFLESKEKKFCAGLLKKSTRRITPADFSALLDIWGLYAQDIDCFKDILARKPEYYQLVGKKMVELEINLAFRREFLYRYAEYLMSDIQTQYQECQTSGRPDILDRLQYLYQLMDNVDVRYYTINPGTRDEGAKLRLKAYWALKKRLLIHILDLFLASPQWRTDTAARDRVYALLIGIITDSIPSEELAAIDEYLNQKKFYEQKDPKSFYVAQLMRFTSSQYDAVINEYENFKDSLAPTTVIPNKDLIDLEMLRVDTYISSNMLMRAATRLDEIEKIGSLDPREIYWRRIQIMAVIGAEEKEDPFREQQYELIRQSRFIVFDSPASSAIVYLAGPPAEIVIRPGPSFDVQKGPYHLLQVLSRGDILYENYLSQIQFPIIIPIATEEKFSRLSIRIKIE